MASTKSTPRVKTPDYESEDSETHEARMERKRAAKIAEATEKKREIEKFIAAQKERDKQNVNQPTTLDDLVMIPASPINILPTIKDYEKKGYRLYSNVFYVSQIFLIFKLLPAKVDK